MKKVSKLTSTISFICAVSIAICGLVFTSCSQVGDSVASCAEVKASDLPASGATTNVTNKANASLVFAEVVADTTTISAIRGIVEQARNFNPNSRAVSLSELEAEVEQAIKDVDTQIEKIEQNDNNGTVSINLKKKGKVTGLADGLSANIGKAKAEVTLKDNGTTVIADAAVDVGAAIDVEKLLAAYNLSGTPIVKGLAANTVANAGFTFTNTSFKGKAGVAFSGGASVKTSTGVGGKFIVNGYISVKGSLTEEQFATLKNMFTDEEVSEDEVNALPINVSLSARFYDDDGNETYTVISVTDLYGLYQREVWKNIFSLVNSND